MVFRVLVWIYYVESRNMMVATLTQMTMVMMMLLMMVSVCLSFNWFRGCFGRTLMLGLRRKPVELGCYGYGRCGVGSWVNRE